MTKLTESSSLCLVIWLLLVPGCTRPLSSVASHQEFILASDQAGYLQVATDQHIPAKGKRAFAQFQGVWNSIKFERVPRVVVATDGHAIVAECSDRSVPGVHDTLAEIWVWEDWRRPDHVERIVGFSSARFLSNRHLVVADSSGEWSLIDVRNPQVRIRHPRTRLRVSDSGSWARLDGNGVVTMGSLRGGHLALQEEAALTTASVVSDCAWIRGGEYLVVEDSHGKLRAYARDGKPGPNSITGHIFRSTGHMTSPVVSHDSIFAFIWHGDAPKHWVARVHEDGRLERIETRLGSRHPCRASPSGKYTVYWGGQTLLVPFASQRVMLTEKTYLKEAVPLMPEGYAHGWLSLE